MPLHVRGRRHHRRRLRPVLNVLMRRELRRARHDSGVVYPLHPPGPPDEAFIFLPRAVHPVAALVGVVVVVEGDVQKRVEVVRGLECAAGFYVRGGGGPPPRRARVLLAGEVRPQP
eukprot:29661-Pelagococcus_subviridis.AAC.2